MPRFFIQVHISFETNEPRRVTFEAPSSIVPPPEIDWDTAPKMNTVPEVEPVLCFDDEVSISTRRLSASEKARQSVIAQRRQSNVQVLTDSTEAFNSSFSWCSR